MQGSVLPEGFSIGMIDTWRLVNQPRAYTAWLQQRYGELITFYHGNDAPFVVALMPESARQVLSGDPGGYDAFWKDGFTGAAGPGSLWVLGGERHRRERSLLSPAFHSHYFRGYGEIIRGITRQKVSRWEPGQTIRAIDTTLTISLSVILRLVFGVNEGILMEQGRAVLYDLWRYMNPSFVFFPWLQKSWFFPWRRYVQAKQRFTQWVNDILTERRRLDVKFDDVLGRMLGAQYEDGSRMRDEDIRDELITILLAGHETTATALAWALYDLGKNPNELETLRSELDTLGPESDPGLMVRLPYLAAVCNETLRYHTLLPEVGRELVRPLGVCGYTLPAGASVGVSIMAIHHNPALYPEPDRYNPSRFIQRAYDPFEFMPFGGGHRRCLGAGLSDYEMRIALAEIVSHWEFEPAGLEQEVRHDIAMGPKRGVLLRIKGRR